MWGLDFGDCRRSLFAHEDSITCVQFVPNTHYLFSVSKDRVLKYWDMDKVFLLSLSRSLSRLSSVCLAELSHLGQYQQLLSLPGHHGEIWYRHCVGLSPLLSALMGAIRSLAIGTMGDFVVTASHDRSIRVWERTDQQASLPPTNRITRGEYFFFSS